MVYLVMDACSLLSQQNRINCDPTHELEEMIVEPNPLHKKRHRLSKRSVSSTLCDVMETLCRVGMVR